MKEAVKDQPQTQDIEKHNKIVVKIFSEAAKDHKKVKLITNNKLSEEILDHIENKMICWLKQTGAG